MCFAPCVNGFQPSLLLMEGAQRGQGCSRDRWINTSSHKKIDDDPAQSQELDLMILMDPFQLRVFVINIPLQSYLLSKKEDFPNGMPKTMGAA